MITLRQLLNQYKQEKKAIPAFNIDTFTVYQAMEEAIKTTKLPAIVQLSPGEDKFIQAERLWILVQKARADGIPVYCNMDHGKDIERLKKLLLLGFDMVHFDGSHLPFEENLTKALELKRFIDEHFPNRDTQPVLEVEFNKINLIAAGVDEASFTKPEEAAKFMNFSRADLLAVSIGNLHGVPSSGIAEHIKTDLFTQIVSALPPSQLYTMHGGSGIAENELKFTITMGVVKININTDLRLAYRETIKDSLSRLHTEKMYEYYDPVAEKLKQVAVHKLLLFQNNG